MNILYASDDKYAPFLSVSISSLLDHTGAPNNVELYIIDNGISDSNKKVLSGIATHYCAGIHYCEQYDFSEFDGIRLYLDRGSITQYARLFIKRILPESVERILYLDCDTLVLSDPTDLYEEELNGCVVGGVEDAFSVFHWKTLGLSCNDEYINSGVMLIDMNQWRTSGIESQLKDLIIRGKGQFLQGDQGLIGMSLRGRIKRLSLKYNVVTYLYAFTIQEMKTYRKPLKYYDVNEIENAKKHPTIVHFTTCFAYMRPWESENCTHPFMEKWIQYYESNDYYISNSKTGFLYYLFDSPLRELLLPIVGIIHSYIKPFLWKARLRQLRCS